ncbi:hypothetical protein Syun_002815 [Stephania yunnanensis]|uniref:FAD-binding FR-type domain-containing protein n=1 Tax=Stephania yunnanensis TaxID=152371 RepID=A0AAP0L1F7_9MAGN
MDEEAAAAAVPLLSVKHVHGCTAAAPLAKVVVLLGAKWMLKLVMWSIFLAWIAIIFLYPTELGEALVRKWITASSGTLFGITGSLFFTFSGPLLILAFLAIAYLHLNSSSIDHEKKSPARFPRLSLWTFPILVDGPFGVVSAAELIGIFLFSAYVFCSIYVYATRTLNSISQFGFPAKLESCSILEVFGLRFGSIGLFCLAFLFLPVARGSLLLRLIDIPFEHATRYHVWLGLLTMLIFTLHALCYLVAWAIQGRLLHQVMEWKNIGVANLPGVITLLAGLFMWVTSLHPVRKKYFELFFYTHQLYVVFFVFLALHVGDFIFSMAAGGIFIFVLDRFLRFCQSRKTVGIISATCFPCGTVELVLSKPKNLQYNALSFIFIQVRELSWLQWHPFSVSSSPLDGENHIAVLIKVLGDWTKKLRDNISSISEEPPKELPLQPRSLITVSVEGPYGHESAYHLKYENLVLVAGGIGVSPFLAILRDIFHHVAESKPCLTEKVLLVWSVKKSDELCLLSPSELEAICPFFSAKLHLEIQIYVTQESEFRVADESGKVCKSVNCSYFSTVARSDMSGLVGTGNNAWSGTYVIISTIGFITLLAVVDSYYIVPFNISSWWYKGLLFVACMIGSVIIFGGLVVLLWHFWDRGGSFKESVSNSRKIEKVSYNETMKSTGAPQAITLETSTRTHYGCRPDFRGIFNSISEEWGHVDVGVIVCGPQSLQSSVAKECRSQNIRGRRNEPFFHFNCHSFDL